MTGISTKHYGHLTGVVVFSTIVLAFSIWFPAGYSVVQINIPQNLILSWIRQTQCARLGGRIENISSAEHGAEGSGFANRSNLWCTIIPEDEVSGQLRENSHLNAVWALIGAAVTLGGTFGVWTANMLIDRLGFRRMFFITNLFLTIGVALSSLVVAIGSYEIFIIGRFLLGFGTGFGSAISFTYIAEITPANFRGALGVAPIISFSIGMLLAAVFSLPQILGTDDYWSYLTLILIAPCVCFFASYAFLLESPRWVFKKSHDVQKTTQILQRLRNVFNVQADLQMIEEENRVAKEKGTKVSIIGLFRNGFLRYNVLICCTAVIAQRLTAYPGVYTYSSNIFRQCGLSKDVAAYGTIGLLGLQAASAVIGSLLMDKAGRKPLMLIGLFGCAMSLIAMVTFAALTSYRICVGCEYGNLAALFVFIMVYVCGPASVPFILPAEMFGLLTRQSATTLIMMLCQGVTAVVSAVFPVMQVYLSQWTFVIFAGVTLILAVILSLTLMETKGKTFLEIQASLEKRYFSGHRKRYNNTAVPITIPSIADLKALPRSISNMSTNSGMKRLY
ncbi:solute carrier family 2, facilitated glucose transporter member 3-like isoform X2 [Paramacrobiotus metropolitanus]|uniref:solute carrier family 2, facilitated glucose transporter member 3-like isoform X2 n=1 Tax=Paramacrobiotus metropolitanus TaxID=2943436 RepID=UPI002445A303|nr:solute carrier family 2, facilitated glucose transporter member 3-like isoform X2 [Paramacrobiotus metropolitanus]